MSVQDRAQEKALVKPFKVSHYTKSVSSFESTQS